MKIETLAVHAASEPDAASGAVATPISLSTTFRHGPAGEREHGFEYIRGTGNPVEQRLESAIAALEQGELAAMFASGMAAASALFMSLPRGAHALIPRDVYMGMRILGAEIMAPLGVTVSSVDTTSLDRVREAFTPATKLVWVETPSNPKLEVSDIAAIAQLAHARGALVAVDNTFATPLLQQPLVLGADVVMHSATKYFGGHSDVMGGALAFARRDELAERVLHYRHVTGGVLAPFNAWLILRGLRSKPFDGEGVRNARRVFAEDGVLTSWVLDSASGRQLGLATTGHAARGTGGPPSPATTNLYMAAGTLSPAELIADIKQGFYVTELIGMGVNGVTGDYSRGASGFWIENGEIVYPVNEITIAGNLKDMFLHITPANDLVFKYGTNAPTLRVEGMTIAGA